MQKNLIYLIKKVKKFLLRINYYQVKKLIQKYLFLIKNLKMMNLILWKQKIHLIKF